MKVHTDAEQYFPPYMWLARPEIKSVSGDRKALRYEQVLTIKVSGGDLHGAEVSLARLGSTTHGNDMDQRYVRLTTQSRGTGDTTATLTARLPTNPAAAPPGDYQLIVLDGRRTPSTGTLVRLTL